MQAAFQGFLTCWSRATGTGSRKMVNSALAVSCPPPAVPPSSRSVTRTRASPAEDTQLPMFRSSGW